MYFLINLDLQIFIKSNGVYSSVFWINVGISRPSRPTWWLLLTLKYKDNRCQRVWSGDAEIGLQDPLRVQGLLFFFASVILYKFFLKTVWKGLIIRNEFLDLGFLTIKFGKSLFCQFARTNSSSIGLYFTRMSNLQNRRCGVSICQKHL
jgi:hypothetical protein